MRQEQYDALYQHFTNNQVDSELADKAAQIVASENDLSDRTPEQQDVITKAWEVANEHV